MVLFTGDISEPPPRWGHFFVPLERELFVWGGCTKHGIKTRRPFSDVYTFDPYHKSWHARSTTGSTPHSHFYEGASASDGRHFYLYGGYDGSSFQGCLHQLDSKTWQWSQLSSGDDRDGPMRKIGCGMVAYANKLVLFGGYGIPSDPTQPGSQFIPDCRFPESVGWTNELHLFDPENGKYKCVCVCVCVCACIIHVGMYNRVLCGARCLAMNILLYCYSLPKIVVMTILLLQPII